MDTRLLPLSEVDLKSPESASTTVTIKDHEPSNLLTIMAKKENEWLNTLSDLSLLPSPYHKYSHQTAAIIFAILSAGAASVLYDEAGKKYGPLYEVGGVTVNLTQNMLYSVGTYFFIKESLNNFKHSWGRLTLATLIAGFAIAPSTISTYEFSDGNLFKALLNAGGTFPNMIFGMYTAINLFMDYKNDNPNARKFLRQKLREALQHEAFLSMSVAQEHTALYRAFRLTVGLTSGLVIATAQAGNVCLSSRYLEKLTNNQALGITLGFGSMLPIITIAILISGKDLGQSAIDKVADLLSGHKKIHFSAREKKFLAVFVTLLATSTWLATYSSAVSKFSFNTKCDLEPTIGEIPNAFLKIMSDQGAILYNSIMSGIAIDLALDFVKKAYAKDDSMDRQNYKVADMNHSITTAPIEKIELIAKTYFPNEENSWKKSPSCFSRLKQRLGFWKTDASAYKPLDDQLVANISPTPRKEIIFK